MSKHDLIPTTADQSHGPTRNSEDTLGGVCERQLSSRQAIWWRTVAVPALVVIHAALIAWNAFCHSPTLDEIMHLPAGISHWSLGRFDLYRVNPPLIRLAAASPMLFSDVRISWAVVPFGPLDRGEWQAGRELTKANGESLFWCMTMARWACIPFSVLGAWICYRWASELYGQMAGLFALTLWCFEPLILGNAALITPDTGAAALGAASGLAFWRWTQRPSWPRTIWAGVTLGLAELAKTTWLVLFIIWPVLWLVCRAPVTKDGERRSHWREFAQLVLILAIAVYLINAAHLFEGSGKPLGEFDFVSRTLTGAKPAATGVIYSGNRFSGSWLSVLPVPLPVNYVLGVDRQKADFEAGFSSYLRGQWRNHGWWYYYVYALAIKVPLGTWTCGLLAAGVVWFGRRYARPWRDEVFVALPAVVVIALVSSQTGFNHHVRYVLPAIPFAFIWISKIARAYEIDHRAVMVVSACGLAWSVGSSLYYYPHSLSYFNELVGGPKHGHEHLLDSNIDWGQDLLFLQRWVESHPEVSPIGLAYSVPRDLLDPADIGLRYVMPAPGADSLHSAGASSLDGVGPLPGWYAIFVRAFYERHGRYRYFEHFEPVAMIGYTVRIYHITSDDANRVRRKLGLPQLVNVRESRG